MVLLIVGTVCFLVGGFVGALGMALMCASKDLDA